MFHSAGAGEALPVGDGRQRLSWWSCSHVSLSRGWESPACRRRPSETHGGHVPMFHSAGAGEALPVGDGYQRLSWW